MDVARFTAAGLYDPQAPEAADRLALLEWLDGRGVTIEQMVHAQTTASLTGLAGDLALGADRTLTVAEAAERVGMTAAQLERIRFACGLPPVAPHDRIYSEADAQSFVLFTFGEAQFGDVVARRFGHVMGESLSRIAEAAVSMFLSHVEKPYRSEQAGDLALAKANLLAVESLRELPRALGSLFYGHMETAIRRLRSARRSGELDTGRLTIGFVDLVGFTSLSRAIEPAALAEVVDRFEDTVHDVVTRHDGRVVKLIGDAVMFVTVKPPAACAIALELADRFADDPAISPRGGLAAGELLMRGGDYYGPVVNVASRVADLAVPSEMLVTAEVAERSAGEALRFEPAGRRLLKGFDEPLPLFSLERSDQLSA